MHFIKAKEQLNKTTAVLRKELAEMNKCVQNQLKMDEAL